MYLWGSPQSDIALMRTFMHLVLPAPLGPKAIMPWRTRCVSNSWMSFRTQGAWCINPASWTWDNSLHNDLKVFIVKHYVNYYFYKFDYTCFSIAPSRSGYPALSKVIPGKRSLIRERNSGSSSSTSLDRFMSRRPRITIVCSGSSGFALLTPPSVRRTERILRSPKS